MNFTKGSLLITLLTKTINPFVKKFEAIKPIMRIPTMVIKNPMPGYLKINRNTYRNYDYQSFKKIFAKFFHVNFSNLRSNKILILRIMLYHKMGRDRQFNFRYSHSTSQLVPTSNYLVSYLH